MGRALAPDYFPLDAGIRHVWEDEDDLLTEQSKRSILRCLPQNENGSPQMPTTEDQLATLHRAVTACGLLSGIEREESIWLTTHGRKFPRVIDHFIGRVAHYFHNCPEATEEYWRCIDGICRLVEGQYTHIATLNYDSLLYQPLIEAGILKGYDGHLIDGFAGMTFSEANMVRRRAALGWYLHLHGSPLFYDNNGAVRKLKQPELDESYDTGNVLHRHIVLSHTKTKPEIISSSTLLSSYWELFGEALDESSRVIVFGYGGGDSHINKQISNWIRSKKKQEKRLALVVVEREDPAKENEARRRFWERKFDRDKRLTPSELILCRHPNILNFDWDGLSAEVHSS